MKLHSFESFQESKRESTKEIVEVCQKFGIKNYTINSMGVVDVNDHVNLNARGLTKLPIKFGKINGNFYCENNQLVSLEGAPNEVKSFFCASNLLASLVGGPQIVSNDFHCSNNLLNDLIGAPTFVGRDFRCDNNKLTTLIGSPQKIFGDYDCSHNQLISLVNGPQEIGGAYGDYLGDFGCFNNQLKDLTGGPRIVYGDYDCDDNQIITLNGIANQIRGHLQCNNNPVGEIWDLFNYNYKFLEIFEMYNLFQIPGIIDSAAIEEIAKHLDQKLPTDWTLKNYQVI